MNLCLGLLNLLLLLLSPQLRDKLVDHNPKYHEDARQLHKVGGVLIEHNAESNCENLSTCYYKGNEVLLELFDHTVDEHLSNCAQYSHQNHVKHEQAMLSHKCEHVEN